MSEDILIRNYDSSDLAAIEKIHEASGIDYRLPDLSKFPVLKVLEANGTPRAAYGMQYAVECYAWLDKSSWADAEGKWLAIKALDREATESVSNLGITNVMCCVPPGYARFGRRIEDLGFSKIRPEWTVYAKSAGV